MTMARRLTLLLALLTPMGASAEEWRMNVGETRVLALNSNSSTGYGWTVISPPGDLLVVRDRGYRPRKPVMPGSPGTHLWRFTAQKPGEASVFFRYARPWEKGGDATMRDIKVTITRHEAALRPPRPCPAEP